MDEPCIHLGRALRQRLRQSGIGGKGALWCGLRALHIGVSRAVDDEAGREADHPTPHCKWIIRIEIEAAQFDQPVRGQMLRESAAQNALGARQHDEAVSHDAPSANVG